MARRIRDDAASKYGYVEPHEAAERSISDLYNKGLIGDSDIETYETKPHKRRRVLGETSGNRRSIPYQRTHTSWIGRGQVFTIRCHPDYCEADKDHL